MVLAGVLLIGALFAGYWGLVLSRQPAPLPPPPPQATSIVTGTAIAARRIETRERDFFIFLLLWLDE